ncbi:MAG: NAD(P)-dependent oxidoreductase [Rhizobiaceae bacterium]|nr:NAD(P)-dependent oxidoreductase [Rhizobiaceae bacterium]
MARVAFIGLGVMGYPMAGHLAKAGHQVTVFNRTAQKAKSWVEEYGGSHAAIPAEAADGCDFVFACVGNDDDLRSVTTDNGGAFSAMKPGSIFIDNTTASADIARELNEIAKTSAFGFLDAPVSGGQAGAQNGALTVMVGGDIEVFDKAKPVIECYSKMVGHMGSSGSGQIAKMVNQICIASLVQGLAEGINFAQNAGLDVENLIEVISKGAAGSWQMSNRYETMNAGEYEHGFAVDWMRKDLQICLAEARNNGSQLPITALVDQFYSEVQTMGVNRWDTASLLARLKKFES